MDRLQRNIIKLAEAEGLKVLGITKGSKHRFVIVSNSLGWKLSQSIHSGNKYNDTGLNNLKADFKRFARGMAHNLHGVTK